MNKKERIASFVAQGYTPAQVASICGVTSGYLSQLIKEAKEDNESEFAMFLRKHQEIEANTTRDEEVILTNKYTAVEHRLLQQIEDKMLTAELPAITAALRVITERQDKREQRKNPMILPPQVQNIIQLTLPSHAIPEHLLSGNKEVVSIGSQNLAPLSSDGVKNLFAQISAAKNATEVPLITKSEF